MKDIPWKFFISFAVVTMVLAVVFIIYIVVVYFPYIGRMFLGLSTLSSIVVIVWIAVEKHMLRSENSGKGKQDE